MRAIAIPIGKAGFDILCKTSADGETFSTEGVPQDAVFRNAYYDYARREVIAIYEHESFGDIPEGVPLPRQKAYLTTNQEGMNG
ncbi:MAG: hypothetical protein ABIH23_07705 [bacterium]